MIVILLVTILGSVLFITYCDKISNFESRVEKVLSDEEETMLSEESTPVQTTIADQEMEHALMVVRQGCLNGKSEEYTVEDILNQYCDRIGSWSARQDEAGDTFKLTGATKNGQEYERYSDFFQEILDEVGV